MRTFYVPRQSVENGQFPLKSLIAWSILKHAKTVIPGFATISPKGEVKYELH